MIVSGEIVLLSATKPEVASIISDGFFVWDKISNNHFKSRKFPVSLIIHGMGKGKTLEVLKDFALENAKLVVSLGTSVALSSELTVGSLCMVSNFIEEDFLYEKKLSVELESVLCDVFKRLSKPVILKQTAVHTPIVISEKEQALSLLSKGATLADMESSIVASLTTNNFFALRYISDVAGELPLLNVWRERARCGSELFQKFIRELLSNYSA